MNRLKAYTDSYVTDGYLACRPHGSECNILYCWSGLLLNYILLEFNYKQIKEITLRFS